MGLLSTLGGAVGNYLLPGIGGAIGAGLGGAIEGRKSVGAASQAQQQAAQGGIDEQRRQFEAVQKLLQPYSAAGTGALQQQMALLGLAPQSQRSGGGGGFGGIAEQVAGAASDAFGGGQTQFVEGEAGQAAQQQAISALEASPQFQALQQQGENAILQNASATGGLRGGNVQGALAQFRPALLSSLINQQYERLGGLSSIGQNAAAGVGNAGMSTGSNIATLLGRQGQAQAGGILGQQSALTGGINQAFGAIQGAGGFGKLFGGNGLNIGTALNYGTNIGSQQSAMLAAQEQGF
jgi:hypothetical protein